MAALADPPRAVLTTSSHERLEQQLANRYHEPPSEAQYLGLSTHTIFDENYAKVEQQTRCLMLSHKQLASIELILENEFKRGLHRDTNSVADIKMYPTHIRDKPQTYKILGHFAEPDEGKFLALDLGGTNFRVILVELLTDNFHMENEVYSLTQKLTTGPGSDLFDYIADCLVKFVSKHNLQGHRLPLGFTFSFPCEQESLSHARLVTWTKGFTCSGVEGENVTELLTAAIKRHTDLDIEVMAVLNDTVGTLVSCAYQNRECRLGLIVGTGTNACYMERVNEVHRMHPGDDEQQENNSHDAHDHLHETTVVNTEWGAFGDNGTLDFMRTKWDFEIDAASADVGKQLFEKMIGGLHIGELSRRVIVDIAINMKLLFHQQPKQTSCLADSEKLFHRRQLLIEGKLNQKYSLQSKYVSLIESDPVDRFENTRLALLESFGIDWASDQDCALVKMICARVTTRAAHLVSAAVACLLNKMARPHTVVGVDGSMFRYHPHFRSIMAKKTKELVRDQFRFQLMFSEDGSGKGAAIVAAVASKQRRISMEMLRNKQLENISSCS